MSAIALLRSLFTYQAWANDDLLNKMACLDVKTQAQERQAALRLAQHNYVVCQIFAAHLTGKAHGYSADNTVETPDLEALRAATAASDRWYLDYLDTLDPGLLSEKIAFTFTDGDAGGMSRAEMLTHVVLHGGYHRGEIGRIMAVLSIRPPWDTYAVHLHATEPQRRLMGRN